MALIASSVIFDTAQSSLNVEPRVPHRHSDIPNYFEDLFVHPPEYNTLESKCESDNDCLAVARAECENDPTCLKEVEDDHNNDDPMVVKYKLTKCGLVEVYQITSIGVT